MAESVEHQRGWAISKRLDTEGAVGLRDQFNPKHRPVEDGRCVNSGTVARPGPDQGQTGRLFEAGDGVVERLIRLKYRGQLGDDEDLLDFLSQVRKPQVATLVIKFLPVVDENRQA